jgi:hypothetical protein
VATSSRCSLGSLRSCCCCSDVVSNKLCLIETKYVSAHHIRRRDRCRRNTGCAGMISCTLSQMIVYSVRNMCVTIRTKFGSYFLRATLTRVSAIIRIRGPVFSSLFQLNNLFFVAVVCIDEARCVVVSTAGADVDFNFVDGVNIDIDNVVTHRHARALYEITPQTRDRFLTHSMRHSKCEQTAARLRSVARSGRRLGAQVRRTIDFVDCRYLIVERIILSNQILVGQMNDVDVVLVKPTSPSASSSSSSSSTSTSSANVPSYYWRLIDLDRADDAHRNRCRVILVTKRI